MVMIDVATRMYRCLTGTKRETYSFSDSSLSVMESQESTKVVAYPLVQSLTLNVHNKHVPNLDTGSSHCPDQDKCNLMLFLVVFQ